MLTEAIDVARRFTNRSKVLSLVPDDLSGVEHITPLKNSLLCRAIAESDQRIAAIITGPIAADPLILKRFLRRVRELASAEGALLIWDETTIGENLLGEFGLRPDLICHSTHLDGRADILCRESV